MSQIRITKTPELERVIEFLKSKWVLLDEVEIVKMALSKMFLSNLEEDLDGLDLEAILASVNDIKNGQYTRLSGKTDISNHFMNL